MKGVEFAPIRCPQCAGEIEVPLRARRFWILCDHCGFNVHVHMSGEQSPDDVEALGAFLHAMYETYGGKK